MFLDAARSPALVLDVARVHWFKDLQGLGRSYAVALRDPAGAAHVGFRFIPLGRPHVECLSAAHVLAGAPISAAAHRPFMPTGVYVAVTPRLREAAARYSAAFDSKNSS